jgi:hypothetical protein
VDAELQIGNDPAVWYFDGADYDRVAAGLAEPGAPLTVEVVAPLKGTLILNPKAAGQVTLQLPFEPVGWIPSGAISPRSPLLYVSSAAGPTRRDPGYTLAAGYTVPGLQRDILAAMTGGTILTVTLEAGPSAKGLVALSGATLAYAVVCPAAS